MTIRAVGGSLSLDHQLNDDVVNRSVGLRGLSVQLALRGVCKTYGPPASGVRALVDVDLDIQNGEFFSLLGPSGCGKTSLLRILAGLENQTAGTISIADRVIDDVPPFKRPVNTVFQSYALFPHFTVRKNIAYGLVSKKISGSDLNNRVNEMLALVQLTDLSERYPGQLSGGQQQRVAIARALAPEPDVLLLDECLSALDRQLRKEMQSELKRIQRSTGVTFVFVTHDQEEAMALSDRMAVLSEGRVVQVGTPIDIYNAPANRFIAGFIGDMNFIRCEALGSRRVSVAGQVLDVEHKFEPGASVVLAVRPECLTVDFDGSSSDRMSAAGMAGTIQDIAFTGNVLALSIELSDGQHLRAELRSRDVAGKSIMPAHAVRVGVEVSDISIYPAAAGV